MSACLPEAPHDCALCPRLAAFRRDNAVQQPDWHNAPVSSFGPQSARLLIVGLAPGLKGANRTGRPFTGDAAGDVLYAMLGEYGFACGQYGADPRDGLSLKDTMITNAVRCVPPKNRPTGAEITACRPFLAARIKACQSLEILLALGRIAHDSLLRALNEKPAQRPFRHGAQHTLTGPHGPVVLFDCYHCSRYNMNTGRLTLPMFRQVMKHVHAALQNPQEL